MRYLQYQILDCFHHFYFQGNLVLYQQNTGYQCHCIREYIFSVCPEIYQNKLCGGE